MELPYNRHDVFSVFIDNGTGPCLRKAHSHLTGFIALFDDTAVLIHSYRALSWCMNIYLLFSNYNIKGNSFTNYNASLIQTGIFWH